MKNERSLSLEGEQLTVFAASEKFWDLEFWKIWIYHCELDGFPELKRLSDEIGGDINECNLLMKSVNISSV